MCSRGKILPAAATHQRALTQMTLPGVVVAHAGEPSPHRGPKRLSWLFRGTGAIFLLVAYAQERLDRLHLAEEPPRAEGHQDHEAHDAGNAGADGPALGLQAVPEDDHGHEGTAQEAPQVGGPVHHGDEAGGDEDKYRNDHQRELRVAELPVAGKRLVPCDQNERQPSAHEAAQRARRADAQRVGHGDATRHISISTGDDVDREPRRRAPRALQDHAGP
mmetsp:Transcript_14830/g.40659  ORF Transcript_14830/g.40659 Transcript_14830/m.40659 type:complete len:219 (-) Transcript_14830:698-1354(-)